MFLHCGILWYKALWSFRYSLSISRWFGAFIFHRGSSLACKIGRNPSRTAVRKLSGMLGGWESAFGGKCSKGMARALHTAYTFCRALCMGVRVSLCSYSSCSLHLSLPQKPGNLSADFDLLSFFFSRAAICLNLAYKVSYFFFSFLKIWFFNAFKQALSLICDCNFHKSYVISLVLQNIMCEVSRYPSRHFFRNMSP